MSVPVAQNFTCAADISGAGYGTAFEPVQRARFEALHSAFLSMGVSLRLDYVYGPEYA